MIDILMSTFNGDRFLGEQIESILSQDHAEFRLVVRDDGSSDDTVRILNDYKGRDERIVLVDDNRGNIGASASFFTLVDRSDADLIMLSDQDDIWLRAKVSRTFSLLQEMIDLHGNENPLAVFTDLKVVDEELAVIADSFWSHQKLDPTISQNWRSLVAQNVVTGCTMMFNKSAKSVVLPCALPTMMHDHWIAAKIAKSGHIAYTPEPTVLYRQHGRNVEGARSAGLSYLGSKIPGILKSVSNLKAAAAVFGDVSTADLVERKLLLNLKRLSSR